MTQESKVMMPNQPKRALKLQAMTHLLTVSIEVFLNPDYNVVF